MTNQTKILSISDLLKILPFKKTKLQALLKAGVLPVVKVGKHYITTQDQIDKWVSDNIGKEIFY